MEQFDPALLRTIPRPLCGAEAPSPAWVTLQIIQGVLDNGGIQGRQGTALIRPLSLFSRENLGAGSRKSGERGRQRWGWWRGNVARALKAREAA